MFKDLIKYEDLYEACAQDFGFGNVTFLRDFGPYHKGDKVHVLWFDLTEGIVQVFGEDGQTEIQHFPFSLTA